MGAREGTKKDRNETIQWDPRKADGLELKKYYFSDFEQGVFPMEAYRPFVRDYRSGGREAFRCLFEGVRRKILRSAASPPSYNEWEELASDVARKACLALVSDSNPFKFDEHGDTAFSRYVSTVKRRDVSRARRRYYKFESQLVDYDAAHKDMASIADHQDVESEVCEEITRAETVNAFVEILPDQLVQVLYVLAEEKHANGREVSEALGLDYNKSSHYRKMKAIRRLARQQISKEFSEDMKESGA